jgi:hypothetical protein
VSIQPNVTSNKKEMFEQLAVRELERELWIFLAASVFWEPNYDPGRFEVMFDVMKLQGLVIAACSPWKRLTLSLTY